MKALEDFWINLCTLKRWKMNILQVIWLFTLKKIAEKFSCDSIIDELKNIKKWWTII